MRLFCTTKNCFPQMPIVPSLRNAMLTFKVCFKASHSLTTTSYLFRVAASRDISILYSNGSLILWGLQSIDFQHLCTIHHPPMPLLPSLPSSDTMVHLFFTCTLNSFAHLSLSFLSGKTLTLIQLSACFGLSVDGRRRTQNYADCITLHLCPQVLSGSSVLHGDPALFT